MSIVRNVLFAAFLLAIAIYLRADGLDTPVDWYDEAITSLRVAGHTEVQVYDYASSHSSFALGELRHFRADANTSTSDTIQSLIHEDPQHTPAYYIAAHWWAGWFGTTLLAGRALAVVFGVMAVGAMYWLCLELFVLTGAFSSTAICWLGVAAMAVSPYQVVFSREHREYSVWSLALILLGALFLRAVRKDDARAWAAYAVMLGVGLYVHLLTAPVAAVFGVYLLVNERFRLRGKFTRFFLASWAGVVLMAPWIYVLLSQQKTAQAGLSWTDNFNIGRFTFNAARPMLELIDVSFLGVQQWLGIARWGIVALLAICGLALTCVWIFLRGARIRVALFITLMIASLSAPLFLDSYLTGSVISFALRYSAPSSLGWTLLLTALCGLLFFGAGLAKWPLRAVAVGLLTLAADFSYTVHNERTNFGLDYYDHGELVDYLKSNRGYALASDAFVGDMLILADELPPEVQISWNPRCFSCPRKLDPVVDIPDFRAPPEKLYYFRSWTNMFSQFHLDELLNDTLDDPHYHTKALIFEERSRHLFELTPKAPVTE